MVNVVSMFGKLDQAQKPAPFLSLRVLKFTMGLVEDFLCTYGISPFCSMAYSLAVMPFVGFNRLRN